MWISLSKMLSLIYTRITTASTQYVETRLTFGAVSDSLCSCCVRTASWISIYISSPLSLNLAKRIPELKDTNRLSENDGCRL